MSDKIETWELLREFCEEHFDNFSPNNYEINGSRMLLTGTRVCLKGTPDAWSEDDKREIDLMEYHTWIYNRIDKKLEWLKARSNKLSDVG